MKLSQNKKLTDSYKTAEIKGSKMKSYAHKMHHVAIRVIGILYGVRLTPYKLRSHLCRSLSWFDSCLPPAPILEKAPTAAEAIPSATWALARSQTSEMLARPEPIIPLEAVEGGNGEQHQHTQTSPNINYHQHTYLFGMTLPKSIHMFQLEQNYLKAGVRM